MSVEKELVKSVKRRRGASKQKIVRDPPASYMADGNVLPPKAGHLRESVSPVSEQASLSLFSQTLRTLLKNHEAVTYLATSVEVAENTVYRWLKGESDPRPGHLQRMLQVFPEQQQALLAAIQQTFPGVLEIPPSEIVEVQKDLYRRIVALVSTEVGNEVRRWNVMQAVFEYALKQLDGKRQGIAIMLAQLMPARADGIHSLYEVTTWGTPPWPPTSTGHVYLGSTSLAGMAAISQHMQTWNVQEADKRAQVDVDFYEQSACAYPVLRGNRLVGVLIVSSTQPDFFIEPVITQSIVEYAQLLGLAFRDDEFKSFTLLNLRPLPAVSWQRAEINLSYINRIITRARQQKMTRGEAEELVRAEMELEFEQRVQAQLT